ncbi:hypothetical protein KBD34_00135 [Patescibacteria group bacterium]|nr:hypothetical protein [Patescibacteria group bacterium]
MKHSRLAFLVPALALCFVMSGCGKVENTATPTGKVSSAFTDIQINDIPLSETGEVTTVPYADDNRVSFVPTIKDLYGSFSLRCKERGNKYTMDGNDWPANTQFYQQTLPLPECRGKESKLTLELKDRESGATLEKKEVKLKFE